MCEESKSFLTCKYFVQATTKNKQYWFGSLFWFGGNTLKSKALFNAESYGNEIYMQWNRQNNGFKFSRCIFSELLRWAIAIKVWANAIKIPDQHKYE